MTTKPQPTAPLDLAQFDGNVVLWNNEKAYALLAECKRQREELEVWTQGHTILRGQMEFLRAEVTGLRGEKEELLAAIFAADAKLGTDHDALVRQILRAELAKEKDRAALARAQS